MSGPYSLSDTDDGLPRGKRGAASIATWIGVALCVLDTSIANIALPSISAQLGVSATDSIWIVNGYQIAITMLLLPMAALAEIAGYRRVYLAGTVLFVVASAGCALAQDLTSLTIARFVQGAGAAGVMGVNPALIRFINPKAMLGRGIGRNAMVVAASSAAGPALAGLVLSAASWRWLFAINLPVGALSLVLALKFLPRTVRRPGPFDLISAGLAATTFGSVFLVANAAARGGLDGSTALEGLVALAGGVVLTKRASGQSAPMIPIDLLKIASLRSAYAISSCAFAASTMGLIAIPFLLVAHGSNPAETGLLIAPWPIAIAAVAPVAGRLSERLSASMLGGLGLTIMTAGLLTMGLLPSSQVVVGIASALCGSGFALFQTPNNRTMLGKSPPARSGVAGGMLATARLVGQTAGAVMAASLFRLLGATSPVTLFIAAALAFLAAGLSLLRRS